MDAVVRTSAGDGRFQRVNRDRVTATGVEVVAGARWAPFHVDGDLTWQGVGVTDPTAPSVERQPEYQPGVAANLRIGVELPASVLARARVSYLGAQFCVNPELERDVRLDGQAWAGVEVERAWRLGRGEGAGWIRVVGGAHNLGDASVYDQCGLPSPGRRLTLMVELG